MAPQKMYPYLPCSSLHCSCSKHPIIQCKCLDRCILWAAHVLLATLGSSDQISTMASWFLCFSFRFKKEAKLYEEVYASHLREPIIKGYLRDTKANKRRWCVLQGNRLHIFKSQEDPAIMIIDLLGCDIGVDDKKKISYSFRLTPKEGPGVSLAIEDGQDLSPWMSAIMAAVVRRGSIDRPNSPLDGAYTLEQARAERTRSAEVDGETEKEDEVLENFYELPVETVAVSLQSQKS